MDVLVIGNANGQWTDGYCPVVVFDRQLLAVNSTAELTVAAVQEIQAVVFDVETDSVTPCAQPQFQFFVTFFHWMQHKWMYLTILQGPRRPREAVGIYPAVERECEGRIPI